MTFFPNEVQFNVVKAWITDGTPAGKSVADTVTNVEANGDLILSDGTVVQLKVTLTNEERDQIVAILDKATDRVKAQLLADATTAQTPPTSGPVA